MKIESPAFTLDDVQSFMDTYLDRERDILAERLQQASDRLAALAPRVKAQGGDDAAWSAHELLAHIAVLSKFYGVLVHRISSGQLPNMDLLGLSTSATPPATRCRSSSRRTCSG